jgi:hypothetical protein
MIRSAHVQVEPMNFGRRNGYRRDELLAMLQNLPG